MVCNAYHIKNVPGRKTDVNDAQWIARCLSQGLLNPSFVPDRDQRELRDMTRFRKSQIEERARNINRLQKFLEGANIKLGSWLSDVEGKSATELLELVIGKPDFTVDDVAARMQRNMKSSAQDLFLSLEGSMTPMQRVFFRHVMDVIREQTAQIEKTDAMIQDALSDNYKAAVEALDTIPGIVRISAEQIIAETGVDMKHFRNQYGRLVSHRGKNRATMAVAHSLLIAVYFVLSGNEFRDLGADYYTQFNREKKINSHVKQLSKLGVVIPTDVLQAAIKTIPIPA